MMSKKKRADLGLAIDILRTIYCSDLPRDHPDYQYQQKVEFPSIYRAIRILEKRYSSDLRKRRKLARSSRG